jgi:hypothetical protein
MMVSFHPSGEWISVGIELDIHDYWWLPQSWQIGFLQSGMWLNIWVTNVKGDKWFKITDFNTAVAPNNGFTGIAYSSDGKTAVWAEIVGLTPGVDAFGVWKLFASDFTVTDGIPSFSNKRDITPADAIWLEPGNFAPDGQRVLLSTDIGMGTPRDAQGQDQWILNVFSGELEQVMNTPKVWDEHGMFSPNGKKIVYMSSYPYQDDPNAYTTTGLKTEIMLSNIDGTELHPLQRSGLY